MVLLSWRAGVAAAAGLGLAVAGTTVTARESTDVGAFSWLAGYWLDCTGDREASEVWSDPRAGIMVGAGITVRGNRSGFEIAHIARQSDGVLAYVAQPDGLPPTVFRLTALDGQRAVFSNPENDFPHRIIYQRDNDRLHARIEGAVDDKDRSAEWTFNRMELNARCPR